MVTGGTSGDQNTERQILATGAAIQSIKLADGRLWRLKPLNLNMLMEVEEKCGKFDMATAASMKLLRYILFVRLKPYADGGLTEEQVGELVDAEVLKNLKGILET